MLPCKAHLGYLTKQFTGILELLPTTNGLISTETRTFLHEPADK